MNLHRLRLENFRQHAATEIEFGPGMTAIIGPNGAGKSTLVEAIGFALYGEQRDKKETVRFHWATGKRFLVRLEFSLGERRFLVQRTDRDASLVQHGEPEIVRAEGLAETTRACERLLGLNFEQFTNSFCAEQKQLAFLQFRSNAVRQEEVARMLGLDRLRLAEDLAVQRRREAALQREALERTLTDPAILTADRDRAKDRLAEAERTVKRVASRLGELEREIETAEAARRQAEQWLSLTGEIQVREGEAAGLVALAQSTEAALREAQAEVAERYSLAAEAEAFRSAEVRLRQSQPLRLAAEAAAGALAKTESEIAGLEEQLAEFEDLDESIREARQRKDEADHTLASAMVLWNLRREDATVAAAEAKIRAEQACEALRRAEESFAAGRCPECGQPIAPDYVATVRERREAAERARSEADAALRRSFDAGVEPEDVGAAREALKAADTLLTGLDARLRRRETLRELREKARERASVARATLEAGPSEAELAELRRLEAEMEPLRTAHLRFEALQGCDERLATRRRQHAEASDRLRANRQAMDALKGERDQLPFADAAAAGHAVSHHQALSEEAARLRAEQAGARAAREVAERDLRHIEERLAAQAALAAEVRRLREQESLHDACSREMRTLRQELNAGVGPELAAHAGENLSLLTNGRYSALELDRNFSVAVIEDGVRKPVLSGGEEDVVALALRLALSELIQERTGQPLSLLILDEVFGSLDVDRRQAVLDRLAALRGRFAQILVVTHLEDVHQVADEVLYVSRDPESRASVVRKL